MVNFIFEPLFVPDVVRLLKFDSGYPTLINNLCLHGNRERDRKYIKTNNIVQLHFPFSRESVRWEGA